MLLILILGFLSLFFIKNSFITMQQNVIGKLYERNPELCAETLQYMFHEDIAKEASEKGTQALISLGYTEKGGYYLYRHMGWHKAFLGIFCLQGILALLLLCLFFHLKRQNHREEELLIQDIRTEKLQLPTYRFSNKNVVLEIAKLLDMLHANDLRNVRQIYLLHLSEANSEEDRFRKEVQCLTGAEVYVC